MQEESGESGQAPFTFRAAIGESPFDGDTQAIPALYTRSGYEEYLIKRCPDIIRGLTDDGWIFGSNPIVLSALDVNRVLKDVRVMYFKDYIRYWSQAIQKLSIRTPDTLADAQKLSEQLTSGISPIVLVLREVRNNTTFVIENTDPSLLEGAVASEAQRKAQQAVSRRTGAKVGQALVGTAAQSLEEMRQRAAEEAMKDAMAVNQYFVPLVSLLDGEGNPRPVLKAAHDATASLGEYFGKIVTSDAIDQRVLSALLEIADEKDATLRTLENAAGKLPTPVRNWYATTASGGLRRMLVLGAGSINRAYQDKVLSVYSRSMRGSYPFDPSSDRDVNLEEFATFFRAGGTLDSFYDTYLAPFVTRSGQMRSIMGRTLPISSQSVVQLSRANRVQEAFFMSGRELGINFLLEPHALDTSLKQVNLLHAEKTVSYWHGPVNGASFVWPGENGASQGILETVDLNGITTRHSARGDWALFRLFKGATIKRQSGNTCLLEVQQNGKWAQFLIQFRNKANPFDPSVCSFILPDSLY
jgi:type VI secretion system protein ImpL